MRVLAIAWLALVACDDAVAIELQIPADVTADRVDIFIGKKQCFDGDQQCTGIGPEGKNALIGGEVFDVDSTAPFHVDVPKGATSVEVRLEPADLVIPRILAIATSSQPVANTGKAGVVVLRDIDLGSGARRYIGVLEAANPDLVVEGPPRDNGFQIWPVTRDPYACAGVQFHGQTTFVVPGDDADCDDSVAASECQELIHLFHGADKLAVEQTTCATTATVDGGVQCTLGGPGCDETGPSPTDGCLNQNTICVAPAICQACNNLDPACILGKFRTRNPTVAARVRCTIHFDTDAGTTDLPPCQGETAVRATIATGGDCSARVGLIGISQLSTEITLPGTQLTVLAKMSGCDYGLTYQGTVPAAVGTESVVAVTEIRSGDRSIAVPLEIAATPISCNTSPQEDFCEIVAADSAVGDPVFSCLN